MENLVVVEDPGDGSMQCTDHPYKNNTPPGGGGICAFCLQEKLGKLVSSSSTFPVTVFPSNSSSSSSPSFRSDHFSTTNNTSNSSILTVRTNPSTTIPPNTQIHTHSTTTHYFKKSKIPFLLKKTKKDTSSSTTNHPNSIIFKRSKSSITPSSINSKKESSNFWSFLYLSRKTRTKQLQDQCTTLSEKKKKKECVVVEENDDSPSELVYDRKVSRSRSVGCGSRSFSGDFFERISTGFGDCTLRRVESQREGKGRVRQAGGGGGGQECIKERVKCGGLFSGFMITSSSSSSSSSSNWVSSSTEDNNNNNNNSSNNVKQSVGGAVVRQVVHGRSKSWGWAFASPMRAFSKPSTKRAAAAVAANKNAAPNLAAIPSLLSVRS